MKKQVKKYSAEEKAKIAIEAISGEMTIAGLQLRNFRCDAK